jgi:hypothetical protein
MTEENNIHLALFKDIDPAAEALDKLRELGVSEDAITIISGVPFSEQILGRPIIKTRVPLFAIAGFLGGLLISLLLNWGAVQQYPINVGNMANLAGPPFLILAFEVSMLGLMIFTFLGVIWESAFPSFGLKMYRPEISDGRIGVMFNCPLEIHAQAHETLEAMGAEWMHRTEAIKL